MTGFCYSPAIPEHDTGAHPECRERVDAIVRAVEAHDWQGRLKFFTAPPCTEADLLRVHTPQHIQRIRETCKRGGGYLDPDTPVSPGSYEAAILAAGLTLRALNGVLDGEFENAFCAVRPPGHHATPSQAMGFCLFNNVAIAARYAMEVHGLERVLIVDWDVHHGNGTQDAFYEEPSVFYFSIHQSPHYPGTGRTNERGSGKGLGKTMNLPQAPFTSAIKTLEDFTRGLQEAEKHDPDLILISAGFDAHREDPLANLRLTESDYGEMTSHVMDLACKKCKGRIVSVLEGGYNLIALAQSVLRHLEVLSGIKNDRDSDN